MRAKLLTCLILAAVIAVTPFAGALAEDEVTLSVATVDAAVGDEVEVAIEIGNGKAVDSIEFNLNYDATALEYVSDEPGLIFPAEYCITNPDEAGRVRAAAICAYGLEESGVMLKIKFRVLSAAGSALTLSDVKITRVDADYNQSYAYMLITDGGVTVDGAALPAPAVTPWVAPTPSPSPSPTPSPTPEPTEVPVAAAEDTVAPEQPTQLTTRSSLLRYILIAVVVLLVIAVIVIIVSGAQQRRRRRRRKKKRKAQQQRRRNYEE